MIKKFIIPEAIEIDCYKNILVTINKVSLMARPIQWDKPDHTGQGKAKDGSDIIATNYITTCPKCSNLINFTIDDTNIFNDTNHIGCKNCKLPPAEPPTNKPYSGPLFKDPLPFLKLDLDIEAQEMIDSNLEYSS